MTEMVPPKTITGFRVVLIALAVVALWLATPFFGLWLYPSLIDRGQFGDVFGSINALFSGLAFAGVIVAILLQREELALQRQELTLTRAELARAAEAQDETQKALNKTIYAQSFKVALDMIETKEIIYSRKIVSHLAGFSERTNEWSEKSIENAEEVIRSFESVGTLVRREVLPASYIIERYSVPIMRNWLILKKFIMDRRKERKDPYVGKDFEFLVDLATVFLKNAGVKVALS